MRIASFFKEPLVAFALAGGALYVALANIAPPEEKEKIEIREETINALLQYRESIDGVAPDEATRQDVIASLVDDEVLLREAYKLGYDRNDSRVRKRLLALMRSTQATTPPAPSATQLTEFYQQNQLMFQGQPEVTFDQVFFEFTSNHAPESLDAFLTQLDTVDDHSKLSDFSMISPVMRKQSRDRVVMLFSAPVADALFATKDSQWLGPLRSRSGIHFFRVTAHHPAEATPFEEVEPYLKQMWSYEEQRKAQQQRIDEMRENYEVVLPKAHAK